MLDSMKFFDCSISLDSCVLRDFSKPSLYDCSWSRQALTVLSSSLLALLSASAIRFCGEICVAWALGSAINAPIVAKYHDTEAFGRTPKSLCPYLYTPKRHI